MKKSLHIPVLKKKVLEFLSLKDNGVYFDGTVGAGGHTIAILEELKGRCTIIGVDRDKSILDYTRERLKGKGYADRVRLVHSSYSRVSEILREEGYAQVDGVLLDLGISSYQVDSPDRGFSFRHEGPLDMRMDKAQDYNAFDLVNSSSFEELKDILQSYGEEPLASRIARAIVKAREKGPIETTTELAEVVLRSYPSRWRRTARRHPATRTFQAIRIAVNRELEELTSFLRQCLEVVRPGGRIVIISFHSLEDRLVKHFFKSHSRRGYASDREDITEPRLNILTKKPVKADPQEIEVNRRARSAKLRAAEVVE